MASNRNDRNLFDALGIDRNTEDGANDDDDASMSDESSVLFSDSDDEDYVQDSPGSSSSSENSGSEHDDDAAEDVSETEPDNTGDNAQSQASAPTVPAQADDSSSETRAFIRGRDGDKNRNNGQKWFLQPFQRSRTSSQNIFTVPHTRIPHTHDKDTPLELFNLMCDDAMKRDIIKFTNEEGVRQRGDHWVPMDDVEFDALIGVLLMIGAQKQSKVTTCVIWDRMIGLTYVRAAMSRNRFHALMKALRFDKKETRRRRMNDSKLAAFEDIFNKHIENLQRYYIPGPYLTVDEQLIPFRGRCSFIQYIPSKPGKYGLKVNWVCDSQNAYPLRGEVYTGKRTDPVRRQTNEMTVGAKTVMRLVEPYTGKGRNVTVDNFFTDNLVTERLRQKKTTLVGTVRRDKKFLPTTFAQKKALQVFESNFAFQEHRALCSYQGHKPKNVILMSTMHDDDAVDINHPKKKPEMVLFYNETKGGVDTCDKLCLTYTTKRKTKRWPVVLFFNMLDTSTVAAQVIFKFKSPQSPFAKRDARASFIREISKDLMKNQIIRRKETLLKGSKHLRDLLDSVLEAMGVQPTNLPVAQAETSAKRGRCGACSWKTDKKGSSRCSKCKCFLCKDHVTIVCPKCKDN